jgi:hypothetical protein|nr:MAG TPA: hypothetical protein [Caudoviricetes sp.]
MENLLERFNEKLDYLIQLYEDMEEIKNGIEIAKNGINTEYKIYKNELFLEELNERLKK